MPIAFRVNITTTTFETQVRVKAENVVMEGSGLPDVIPAESDATVAYAHNSVPYGMRTQGTLQIEGFEPVKFSVAHDVVRGQQFIGVPGRRRYTLLTSEKWNWRESGDKPTEGQAADMELSGALLRVFLRPATPAELRRCLQLQALRDAAEAEDYTTLHAQVAKAKQAGVEIEHIDKGEERLKELRQRGLHVESGCDKQALQEQMQWDTITNRLEDQNLIWPCQMCNDCPCNVEFREGETLDIIPHAVQAILGPGSDKELFEELTSAALAAQEGSVWRAGGKLIFSAFDRNQSMIALTRMLANWNRSKCAKMLLQLAAESEKKYNAYVTAVQINFHPDGTTFHDQHRDIYSAKQRAGPNCACSFREGVGTVCYSLGSSRMCRLESKVDDFSAINSCGDDCAGRTEHRWLHSGDAMYFNNAWNQNHTHGVPQMDQVTGPRISIAFLLGSEAGVTFFKKA